MTDATVSTKPMTLDEFIRIYETEGPFEIIGGERIAMSPTVTGHNRIVMRLVVPMQTLAQQNQLGEVMFESPFVLHYDSNWVKGSRVPDIMFVAANRFDPYCENDPEWRNKPLVLVPDLAAEVISMNDNYLDVDRKVRTYLDDGVKIIWVINPRAQTVVVYEYGSNQHTTLNRDDALTAEAVIPGFEIKVGAIFS
jgi:Uma2 family endonuclease